MRASHAGRCHLHTALRRWQLLRWQARGGAGERARALSHHAHCLIKGSYTESRLPVELVFSEYYERVDEAVAAERRIKGWSRAKKEAMMRGDFVALSALAKRTAKPVASKSDPSSFETQASPAPQDEGS
jgi:putative endonuclease